MITNLTLIDSLRTNVAGWILGKRLWKEIHGFLTKPGKELRTELNRQYELENERMMDTQAHYRGELECPDITDSCWGCGTLRAEPYHQPSCKRDGWDEWPCSECIGDAPDG